MEPLRILIADDHPLFRKGMRAVLESLPDLEVVGEASTGAGSVAARREPGARRDRDGPADAGRQRHARAGDFECQPHIRILMVTLFEDNESVFTALRAGARGYILKDAGEGEMTRAIQAVGRGEAIFSPTVATRLMDFFAAPHPSVPKICSPA
jgi:DNA-binding NarL/FixJ family response regulator